MLNKKLADDKWVTVFLFLIVAWHYIVPLSLSGQNQQTTDLWYFFLIFPERVCHFMQTVSSVDNLHEVSHTIFWRKKNKETISNSCLMIFLPSIHNHLQKRTQSSQSSVHLQQRIQLSPKKDATISRRWHNYLQQMTQPSPTDDTIISSRWHNHLQQSI